MEKLLFMRLTPLLSRARENRVDLFRRLEGESTDCWRCFHGATEGFPGLTVDRYGPIYLAQTFHSPLATEQHEELRLFFGDSLHLRDRSRKKGPSTEPESNQIWAREFGLRYYLELEHRGLDPYLFLDFRMARRWLRQHAQGKSVLNLFAYTGSAGLVCSAAGSESVCQVDFSGGNLEVARKNYEANGLDASSVELLQEDCYPVLWQFAGRAVKGRAARRRKYTKLKARRFELIILDPPAWSKSPFGAVDLVNDYPSLLKPCIECLSDDGMILCSNNVASVSIESFVAVVKRCAEKAGRPVKEVERLLPESDFPSPDGRPPLKVLVMSF